MSSPFAQAIYDAHFDDRRRPLVAHDGEETEEHSLDHYFSEFSPEAGHDAWLESWLDGPVLDMGAGAGRHALYFQDRFETVAIEQSDLLVETMRDRGVEDARQADMFALREHFERDRFASALAIGTQTSLSGSLPGLRRFLRDLAFVTTPDATAVVDGFDPEHEVTKAKLDYRADPARGLAYRVLQYEYDGTLGAPWLYRLFTPDRVREAVVGTGWEVAEVKYGDDDWSHLYEIALRKR
ncbi:SAM-dependent methyltransferase [Halobacteriales archaeon SW_6_65_15]|jgi:SAM-dependent methyltransferase|nr:MAG: SAM-dependent methyltransferase [Halobacteriales archaeon SW_6_65_15]